MNPIFPTAYMPPIAYFALLLKYSDIWIETQETFPKQTWRNRCTILSAQGPLNLTIPVIKPYGNHTKTGEIQIDDLQKWRNNHWRAIESAYSKSPYFLYCGEFLKELFYSKETSLLRFNHNFMLFFLDFFKLKREINYTQDYLSLNPEEDLRWQLQPKGIPLLAPELFPSYYQVFSDRFPFYPNLSMLDLVVNEGPYGVEYLRKIADLYE